MSTEIVRFHCIKSLSVVGGFLDGLDVEFSEGLNCLIGHRGTGKTTILEFIRYALDIFPTGDGEMAERKRIDKLIKSNLGNGSIRVAIKTKDGLEYIVARGHGNAPNVLTVDGAPTPITLKSRNFFAADIFSQNAVETIADDGASQLVLIDKFAAGQIDSLDMQISKLRDELHTNAMAIIPLMRDLTTAKVDLGTLPDVEAKLKTFTSVGGTNSDEVNKAYENKSLRERESSTIGRVTEFVPTLKAESFTVPDKLKRCINSVIPSDLLNGPNGEMMEKARSVMALCESKIRLLAQDAVKEIEMCCEGIKTVEQELSTVQSSQDKTFTALINKHKESQGQAAERAQWEQKRNQLLAIKQKHDELKHKLDGKRQERQQLLNSLSELVDKRFALRQQVANSITAQAGAFIRVRLTQFGNKQEYERFLADKLSKSGIMHNQVARRVSTSIPPMELANAVRTNNSSAIETNADISHDQAEKVVSAFSILENQFALETIVLEDKPCIELLDGEYKDSLALSTGQKCTTILPILLMESENPLLIDQPEDNLDNRFICDTVVEGIHRVKKGRQLILATHNPNIPVLGNAEKVFVLGSNGTQASVSNSGTVENCKTEIVSLLEGGREAFLRRKKEYNY